MKILVFDNYDSFTYNLVHIVEKIIDDAVTVVHNDSIAIEAINEFDKIVLSPGPGIPSEAGILIPLIKQYAPTKSILGVCLGHQAIGEAFGSGLYNLPSVFHGVSTPINLKDKLVKPSTLFTNIPNKSLVGRYHSWVVPTENFPNELEVTAVDDYGNIMAMQHKVYDVQGVQFHPESVLTPCGEMLLGNWLQIPHKTI